MDVPLPLTAVPLRGDPARARVEMALLGAVLAILVVSGVAPRAGHQSWILETAPGIAGVAVLIAVFRRFPMSRWVYAGVVIHMLILAYGGYYTYALTPLGNWAKEAFGLARNPSCWPSAPSGSCSSGGGCSWPAPRRARASSALRAMCGTRSETCSSPWSARRSRWRCSRARTTAPWTR